MTHKEIGEYVAARVKLHEAEFKEHAILLHGQFKQWAATQAKHPKILTPKELYPAMFAKNQAHEALSDKEKRFLSHQRWRSFLGV